MMSNTWRRPLRLLAMPGWVAACTLVYLLTGALQLVVAQDLPPNGEAKIGQGVIATLQAEGQANVAIALVAPPSIRAPQLDLPALRREIATLRASVLSQLSAADYRSRLTYQAIPALAGKVTTVSGLAKLAANPNVLKIDLDVGGSGDLANSVPLIGADGRHLLGNSGEGVVVAVLDSGVDTDHDDLADDLIAQECFLDNDGAIDGNGLCPNGSDRQSGPGAAEDNSGHGTHVAGIITSGGLQSAVGVAPDAKIVAIKVLNELAGFSFFQSSLLRWILSLTIGQTSTSSI